jgi:hypothetical protein
MVNLKCGCEVTEDGEFVLGENCTNNECRECNAMQDLHPFGTKRFDVF